MRFLIGSLVLLAVTACESDRQPATTPPLTSTTTTTAVAAPPVRIMPLGDSITQGDSNHDTYRRPLWKTLELEGYRVDFVGSLNTNRGGPPPSSDFDRDHEGHWGWRVDQILERIRRWVEEFEPDVVLVHLGSNDMFQRQSVEGTIEELRELIRIIRENRPGATILLAQILPTTSAPENARIERLNARIPDLAGPGVVIVDQHTGFDAARMTYDGVHPNADGEIHLSDRWLAALKGVLAARSGF